MPKKKPNPDGKLPYLQLYVADYLRDTRHLSPAARGAWLDILCAMHVSVTRGVVIFDKMKLARFVGVTVDQAAAILDELRDPNNATGRSVVEYRELDNGHYELTSRRMVRDEESRQSSRLNGKLGGNPRLKGGGLTPGVNPNPTPGVNPGDIPKSQSQSHIGEVSPNPSGASDEKAMSGSLTGTPDTPPPKPKRQRASQAIPLPEIPEPLDTTEFRRVWALFVGHRQQSRHPLTANAVICCFDRLIKMGVERAVEAIEHSAANGWRGIHEPTQTNRGNYGTRTPQPRRTAAERGEYEQPADDGVKTLTLADVERG